MRRGQKRPFTRRIAYKDVSDYIADLAEDSEGEIDTPTVDLPKNTAGKTDYPTADFAEDIKERDSLDAGVIRDTKVSPGSPARENDSFRSSKRTLSALSAVSTFNPAYEFGWLDILLTVGAILFFFLDLGSDVNITVKYFLNQEWVHGGVTLALTAGPSIITCALGVHWYLLDYHVEKKMLDNPTVPTEKKEFYKTQSSLWTLRFGLTVLQMGPVMRYMEYLWYGWQSRIAKKTRIKRRYYRLMLYEDVDAALLRLFEAFLEAAPQLTYQLYIWISLRPEENTIELSARLATTLSSWLGLALALASYHRSLRFSRAEKVDMSLLFMLGYMAWRSFEVGGRVLCIAMFASAFDYWVFLPCLLHWAMASLWLMCQRTAFYEHTFLERAFNVICGYVMIFCFLNMREGFTRWRYLAFYIVFYMENGFMTFAWLCFAPHGNPWYHLYGFIIVVSAAGIHILLQLLYYKCCHPTGNIRFCLPCDRTICHESICSDLNRESEEEERAHAGLHTLEDVYKSEVEKSGGVVDL